MGSSTDWIDFLACNDKISKIMRKFKRFTIVVSFQIGVNVIGIPDFWFNYFYYDYRYEARSNFKFLR